MLNRFKRLESFRAVVAHGGVTAAALMLHKAASAVSYDLTALQQELGVRLLSKQGRGLVLTPQGRILAEAVARADRDFQRTLQRLQDPQAAREPLRICAVSGFGRYRLATNLMRTLPKDRPLEIALAIAENVLRDVESGQFAYGLSYKPLTSNTLSMVRVAEEQLVLIGPAKAKVPKRIEITHLPFITYDEFEFVYHAWFAAQALAPPERWHRVDHYQELEEAIAAVKADRGYCVVPWDAAKHLVEQGAIQVFKQRMRICRNAVYLLSQPHFKDSEDAKMIQAAVR
jgi:DNA-binding transcriptional LysR family regulator